MKILNKAQEMDEDEIAMFSNASEGEKMNRSDQIGNPFNKPPGEHTSTTQFENNSRREDGISAWIDEHKHHSPTLRQDSEDDLNVILPAFDVTDSAIGNDTYFLASIRDTDKPIENGDAPLLSDANVLTNLSPEQMPPQQDAGCATDCVYYTLMCCECSIL